MKPKRNLVLVLAMLLMASLLIVTSCGTATTPATTTAPTQAATPAEKSYEWKLGEYKGKGSLWYDACELFIKVVEEKSNGRIKITHYPGQLLGDWLPQAQALMTGSQELGMAIGLTSVNPRWNATTLGYVNYNYEQAIQMMQPGGPMQEIRDKLCGETGWKLLASPPEADSNVISNKLFDPVNPGGLKVRVFSREAWLARYSSLGFNPVSMAMSEVPSALATGAIDAGSGASHNELSTFYGDAFKYVYAYHDSFAAMNFVMNLELWNSLSSTDQAILLEAGSQMDKYAWDKFGETITYDWNSLLPWQIVVTLNGDEWSKCAEKVRKAEWSITQKYVGSEIMDKIRSIAVPLPWGKTLDEMNYGYGVLSEKWVRDRQGAVGYNEIKVAGK